MTVKLLAPDKEMVDRMLKGCRHYKLLTKYNRSTNPYVHVEINSPEDAEALFWLGANLAHPKMKNSLYESIF